MEKLPKLLSRIYILLHLTFVSLQKLELTLQAMMLANTIKPKGEGEEQGGQEERKKIRRKENRRGTKNRDLRELQEHINFFSL